MFRFVLQTAFIRRVLQIKLVRFVLVLAFVAATLAGIFYAAIVFKTVQQRSQSGHVQHHSSH